MDSWTFNKISGAVLGTILLLLTLSNLSGIIFHIDKPSKEKPGYLIEVAEAATPEGGEGGAPAEAKPIGVLLASADATKGQGEYKACAACHTPENGGAAKTGPNLWDIVDRPKAAAAGFAYSEGLKAMAADKWTYENLNAFLIAPKTYVKGTKMAYGGIKNDEKRANLIAYLASLSDAPKPFPAAQ